MSETLHFSLVMICSNVLSVTFCCRLESSNLYLADVPENQMGMAVVRECFKRFGKDEGNRISRTYMMRWYALCEAFNDGVLNEFVQVEGERVNSNPAVFYAAARAPIKRDGLFDPTEFLALIRALTEDAE